MTLERNFSIDSISDIEMAQIGSGAVGSSRQQLEIIGGSQSIGSSISYLFGFRGQGLLHILLHSKGGWPERGESELNRRPLPRSTQIFEKCFR
jgi:hypothetical protein